jgi:phosphate transport system permease protein
MAEALFARAAVSHVAQAPTTAERRTDSLLRSIAWSCAFLVIALVAYLVLEIGDQARPAIDRFGLDFITGTTWDTVGDVYGVLPEIWGTLYSSLIALLLGGAFGIGIAVFITQGFIYWRIAATFRVVIELLAAIPSVVFGLWGIYVLIPALRPVADWLHQHFGMVPLFDTSLNGPGLAPAAIVLAVMILPTVAAISVDALRRVPFSVTEAAYAMGTTRAEAIFRVMLPTASSGILAALVLGFGRALGETMALAMLIGNNNQINLSLFAPANTLAARLASSFPEADKSEVQALMFAALVLLAVTLLVNVLGLGVQQLAMRKFEAKR